MATLTALGASNGFTAGDLSLKGYIGAVPAYQKVFLADGRPYNDNIALSGYHKIDMVNTALVGVISATKRDYFDTGSDTYKQCSSTTWLYQTFTASADSDITKIELELYRNGSPGLVTVNIYNTDEVTGLPIGTPLVTGTTDGNTLPTGVPYEKRSVTLSTLFTQTIGTKYAIVVHSAKNGLRWRAASTGGYATGEAGKSTNSGAVWVQDGTYDFMFACYSSSEFIPGETVTQRVSEVQSIAPNSKALSGTFTITYSGETTNNIAWDATLADIQAAIEALSNVENGSIIVTGAGFDDAITGIILTFDPSLGDVDIVTCDISGLTGTTSVTITEETKGDNSLAAGTFQEKAERSDANWFLIYRTTTVEFDTDHPVVGLISGTTMTPTSIITPPLWLNWKLSKGEFPDGGSNSMELFEGRIWMNSMYNPNQWYGTRQGNPNDLDIGADVDDVQKAIASQSSDMGEVGDALIRMIAFNNIYLLFACADSLWILRGGSTGSGSIMKLSPETGIFGPDSFCFDNQGNLYIIGMSGFYKVPSQMATSQVPLDCISDRILPSLFSKLKLNRITDRVVVGFDKDRNCIEVAISMQDGTWSVCFNYDVANDAIFPDTFTSVNVPTSFLHVDSVKDGVSGMLIGTQSGYIKRFDEETKSDDGVEISSYSLFGPINIGNLLRPNAKLRCIQIDLSDDCDGVRWGIYSGNTAKEVVDKIEEETVEFSSAIKYGTFTTGGRQDLIDDKFSGEFLGILFRNKATETSWGFESIKMVLAYDGKDKD